MTEILPALPIFRACIAARQQRDTPGRRDGRTYPSSLHAGHSNRITCVTELTRFTRWLSSWLCVAGVWGHSDAAACAMAAMKGFKDLKEIEEPSKSTPSREGAGDDDQAPLKEPNGNVAAPEAEAADHDVDAPPGAGSDWRAPIFRCCSRGWSGSVVWCNRVDGVLVSGKFLPVFADFLDDRTCRAPLPCQGRRGLAVAFHRGWSG